MIKKRSCGCNDLRKRSPFLLLLIKSLLWTTGHTASHFDSVSFEGGSVQLEDGGIVLEPVALPSAGEPVGSGAAVDGRSGAKGDGGFQGPAGPQGSLGSPGPAGSQAGATGDAGIALPHVIAGFDSVSFRGRATLLGDANGLFDDVPPPSSGPVGQKSDAGVVGSRGPAGESGQAGKFGEPGPAGLEGASGPAGSIFPPDEPVGATGATGQKGALGPAGPNPKPPLNDVYPHLGEISPETAIPVSQVLREAAIPALLRAEVERFLAGVSVDSLLKSAWTRVNSETQASDTLSLFDRTVTLTQASRVNLGRQPSGAAWPALDKYGRVWQYVTEAALRLTAGKSQQFKDALLILLNAFFRDTGVTTNPARCITTTATAPLCSACSPYRTADGTCNNLRHPLYGRSSSPQRRFVAAAYQDGIASPRQLSVFGVPLPSARLISTRVLPRTSNPSALHTHMLMQWSQFVDHDLSLTPTIAGADGIGLTCCADDIRRTFGGDLPYSVQQQLDGRQGCFNIAIPPNDPYYRNRTCMGFSRSSTVSEFDCKLGVRSQINAITSFMDASMVYGSTQEAQSSLRTFTKGKLRTLELSGRRSMLPQKEGLLCNRRNGTFECFLAGDGRVNEQPALAALHTVMVREHNRIAAALGAAHSDWSDEKLFHETRRIVGAEIQHITYSEFLPIVLGPGLMDLFDLKPKPGAGFYSGYNEEIDAAVRIEFSTVAFRFGHSLIRDYFSLNNVGNSLIGTFQLHKNYFSPDLLYNSATTDSAIIRGLVRDRMENCDRQFTTQVGERLFETGGLANTPLDLMALNVQRGRDHGIPSYVRLRQALGMTVPTTFEQLSGTHDQAVINSLKNVYAHVNDIDAFVGGISERPLPGAVVGPMFGKILALQFSVAKSGDRFFYENDCISSFPSPCGRCNFNAAQLGQIKKVTLSRLLCDNVDITTIQSNAFRSGLSQLSCNVLPRMDLSVFNG